MLVPQSPSQTLLCSTSTEADTLEQVIPHVADALGALLELYEDLNKPIPPALRPLIVESETPIWIETLIPAVRG